MLCYDSLELWFTAPKKPSWLQRIIMWRTFSPVSHVELVVHDEDDRYYGCSASLSEGVRIKPVEPGDEWVREPVPLPPGKAERIINTAVSWFAARQKERAPYDVRSLIEFLRAKPSSDQNAYTCGESVIAALQSAGLWTFLDAASTTPKDLLLVARAWRDGVEFSRRE